MTIVHDIRNGLTPTPLFDVHSLDVVLEVEGVVDGLLQLAILELEVDRIDSLREFEV